MGCVYCPEILVIRRAHILISGHCDYHAITRNSIAWVLNVCLFKTVEVAKTHRVDNASRVPINRQYWNEICYKALQICFKASLVLAVMKMRQQQCF